jgi:S1-C subfamily serine protease
VPHEAPTISLIRGRKPISDRWGLTLVGAAIVMALAWPSTVAQNISPQTTQAVVQVLYDASNRRLSTQRFGTAFHVGAGVFYTNAHVANPHVVSGMSLPREYDRMSLADPVDRRGGWVEVVCVDSRWAGSSVKNASGFDVAMVRAPQLGNLPALHFADHPIEPRSSPKYPRERVLVVGYPDRGDWGMVSDITFPAWHYKFFGWIGVVTEQVMTIDRRPFPQGQGEAPGSSGSPVLNESGEVIGIAFADGQGTTGPILAVPVPAATAVCH